jgi:hypothetical protein
MPRLGHSRVKSLLLVSFAVRRRKEIEDKGEFNFTIFLPYVPCFFSFPLPCSFIPSSLPPFLSFAPPNRNPPEALKQWEACIPEPQATTEVAVPLERDPRDCMFEFLFTQKRFSLEVFQRALQIYTQSRAQPRPDADMATIKGDVVRAIEAKIRSGELELDTRMLEKKKNKKERKKKDMGERWNLMVQRKEKSGRG